MAARVLIGLVVGAAQVFVRAGLSAYQQALVNARKQGMTADTVKRAGGASTMALEEAYKILGVSAGTPREEVLARFRHMWKINEGSGSFYLQSKVFRAMEAIDAESGIDTPDPRVPPKGGGDAPPGGRGGAGGSPAQPPPVGEDKRG